MTTMMSPRTPLSSSSTRPATSSTLRRKAVFSSAHKLKQPPLTPQQAASIKAAADAELARERQLSDARLKSTWERIFSKYGKDFEGIADEIDPLTGDIIVDNGHLRGLSEDEDDVWEPTKRKRSGSPEEKEDAGFRKRRKEDLDVPGTTSDCDKCKDKDELDDTLCKVCGPRSSVVRPHPRTIPDSKKRTPRVKPPTVKESNSSPIASSPLSQLPNGVFKPRSSIKKLSSSMIITIPDDEVDELSLPSPTPSRISTPVQQNRPTNIPKKSPLVPSPISERTPRPQVIVEIRSRPSTSNKAENKLSSTSKKIENKPLTVATATESPVIRKQVPPPIKKLEKSPFKPVYGRRGQKPTSPLAFYSSPLGRSTPISPQQLATKSTVPTSPPRSAWKLPPTSAKSTNLWARPPPEADPFYDSLWDDQHPDGTPVLFPPRPKPSATFLTPAPLKAEKWAPKASKPVGATTVKKKKRETVWLNFLEERDKVTTKDEKNEQEKDDGDGDGGNGIMNGTKDKKDGTSKGQVPKTKTRQSLVDIYDVPDDSPEPVLELVSSSTNATHVNGVTSLPKKCGDVGYHCGRVFCFSCVGDDDEDDLI